MNKKDFYINSIFGFIVIFLLGFSFGTIKTGVPLVKADQLNITDKKVVKNKAILSETNVEGLRVYTIEHDNHKYIFSIFDKTPLSFVHSPDCGCLPKKKLLE